MLVCPPSPLLPAVPHRRARRRSSATPEPDPCRLAADVAARHTGLTVDELLRAEKRDRRHASARALGMYLAHVGLGQPMRVVARGFGRHPSTVAHACRCIEERREVAGWDDRVAALEDEARRLMADRLSMRAEAYHGA